MSEFKGRGATHPFQMTIAQIGEANKNKVIFPVSAFADIINKEEIAMPIYVVTSGSHSDYHIVACTTDLDAANRALECAKRDSWNGDTARIEEYTDCRDMIIDLNIDKQKFFEVCIEEGSDTIAIRESMSMPFSKLSELMYEPFITKKYSLPLPVYLIRCSARDKDHAKKIALDRIAEYKAKEAGIS